MWIALTTTFAAARAITYSIRGGRGPLRDVSFGGTHVHHYMAGIIAVGSTGFIAIRGEGQARHHPLVAIAYGTGPGAHCGRVALLLNLKDVYWA